VLTSTGGSPSPSGAVITHPIHSSNFRRWWIGVGVSLLGDQFYFLALPWAILQLTGSAVAMGSILMLTSFPRAILMLIGGAISDFISPRQIMMITASSRTVLVATIGCLIWSHALQLWHLYFLAFAFGVADAFALPASQAFLPSLVLPEQLVAANSFTQVTVQLVVIIGPAPAGWTVKTFGSAAAFFVDAISFLFIIAALWQLPDPQHGLTGEKAPVLWRSIIEGLEYVYHDHVLRSLLLLSAVLNLCVVGPITLGLAFLAKERFDSPATYGLWVSSFAAGGVVGSLGASLWRQRKRGPLLLWMSVMTAVAIASVGSLKHIWLIAAILFVMSSGSGFVNVHFQAWCQQYVDRAVLGRLMSVFMLATVGLTPASLFLSGILAQRSVEVLFWVSGLSVLVTVGIAALHRSLQEIQ
jgi:MFS family permease